MDWQLVASYFTVKSTAIFLQCSEPILQRQQRFSASDMSNNIFQLFPSSASETGVISNGRKNATRTASGENHNSPPLTLGGYTRCISEMHFS